MVKALVTWECRGNGTDPEFLPYLLEVRFGFGREGKPALDIAGDFARFRLHGIVDRLDRDREGNLRVIDYKSGSTAYSRKDLEKGLALQTALYALAADQFWVGKDSRVLESQYWLIPKREASGKLGFSGSLIDDLWVQTAVQQAALSVSLVRVGVFPSAPAKPALGGRSCRDNCDYAPICRVSRQSYVKGRRTNWA
jgi:hypothetical protein